MVARPRNKLSLIINVRPIAPPWLGLRFLEYISRRGDPRQDLLDSLWQHAMQKNKKGHFQSRKFRESEHRYTIVPSDQAGKHGKAVVTPFLATLNEGNVWLQEMDTLCMLAELKYEGRRERNEGELHGGTYRKSSPYNRRCTACTMIEMTA